jgi:hypothetical protein
MRFVWQSGLILVTPILIWNILLHHDLPPSYQHGGRWNDYPLALSLSEHITRVLTFVLCAFLIIDYSKPVNYRAWTIYIVGTLLYFGSWLAVILWPLSNWSQSLIGFTSPRLDSYVMVTRDRVFELKNVFKKSFSQIFILLNGSSIYVVPYVSCRIRFHQIKKALSLDKAL